MSTYRTIARCKIFSGSMVTVQREINEWLEKNAVSIESVTQSQWDYTNHVCITIFYRPLG